MLMGAGCCGCWMLNAVCCMLYAGYDIVLCILWWNGLSVTLAVTWCGHCFLMAASCKVQQQTSSQRVAGQKTRFCFCSYISSWFLGFFVSSFLRCLVAVAVAGSYCGWGVFSGVQHFIFLLQINIQFTQEIFTLLESVLFLLWSSIHPCISI